MFMTFGTTLKSCKTSVTRSRDYRPNWCERIFLVAWLGICFSIMTEGTLWGGDCSGPGDCTGIPDNGTRDAAAGAALAGGGLAWRSHNKKKKPDPCQGERDAVQAAEAALQSVQSQIDALQQQLAQRQDPG